MYYDDRMWKKGSLRERKTIIPMTPVRTGYDANLSDTVRAGTGALSFYRGTEHKVITSSQHGNVEPNALVMTCPMSLGEVDDAEMQDLHARKLERRGQPVCLHIGYERRLETSAISGPAHVQRTIALLATVDGTMTVTVEPGWEVILWNAQ